MTAALFFLLVVGVVFAFDAVNKSSASRTRMIEEERVKAVLDEVCGEDQGEQDDILTLQILEAAKEAGIDPFEHLEDEEERELPEIKALESVMSDEEYASWNRDSIRKSTLPPVHLTGYTGAEFSISVEEAIDRAREEMRYRSDLEAHQLHHFRHHGWCGDHSCKKCVR